MNIQKTNRRAFIKNASAGVGVVSAGGLTRGPIDPPVFNTDFGVIGMRICFDFQFFDGFKRLGQKGAEIVFWPSAYCGGRELYEGKVFIDASYEGDLMGAAGISYTIGREANEKYGEDLNGVQDNESSLTLLGTVSDNGRNHNFVDGVDPYLVPGDISSGVLPFIDENGPGEAGAGDHWVQAYYFKMCLTDHPENRIPFVKPDNYNELQYELLFRNYESVTDP